MVGQALLELDAVAPNASYVAAAQHIADLLAKNMGQVGILTLLLFVLTCTRAQGDAMHSPWPFRVDCVTGAPTLFSRVNSNSAYFLRSVSFVICRPAVLISLCSCARCTQAV